MTPKTITLLEGSPYWAWTFNQTNPSFTMTVPEGVLLDFPWIEAVYESRQPWEQENIIRYLTAFRDGGVIASGNVECLSPLDQVTDVGQVVLGTLDGRTVENEVIVTPAREELWLLAISMLIDDAKVSLNRIVTAYENDYKEDYVQNRITNIRVKLGGYPDKKTRTRITRLEPHLFYPLNPSDPIHEYFAKVSPDDPLDRETACRLFPKSFTVCYW